MKKDDVTSKLAIVSKLLFVLCLLTFCSCQKAIIDDANEEKETGKGAYNVTFNIIKFEQVAFGENGVSRAKDIKSLCSRVCLAIYNGAERVKSETQKSTDSDFGTISLKLDEGTYRALIVAHSQSKNPTTTDPDKVQFDNDLTDLFYWSKEINIKEGASQNIDVDMHRQVAMVRFVTTDNIPSNVKRVDFFYTGGSAALNAATGLGSVNSKQTAKRSITADMVGKPGTFEIYSIPKAERDNYLKIEVTGYDSNNMSVFKRTFDNVPIEKNVITVYKGELFAGTDSPAKEGETKFTLTTNDEWDTVETTF